MAAFTGCGKLKTEGAAGFNLLIEGKIARPLGPGRRPLIVNQVQIRERLAKPFANPAGIYLFQPLESRRVPASRASPNVRQSASTPERPHPNRVYPLREQQPKAGTLNSEKISQERRPIRSGKQTNGRVRHQVWPMSVAGAGAGADRVHR